jgi:hypothetical protein
MGNEVCHHHKDQSVNTVQGMIYGNNDGCDKRTKKIECVGSLQIF